MWKTGDFDDLEFLVQLYKCPRKGHCVFVGTHRVDIVTKERTLTDTISEK